MQRHVAGDKLRSRQRSGSEPTLPSRPYPNRIVTNAKDAPAHTDFLKHWRRSAERGGDGHHQSGAVENGSVQTAGTITLYAASGPTVTAARPLRPHRRRWPASLQAQLPKILDKTSRIGIEGVADSQATGPRPTKAASVPTQRLRERNLLWRPSRARCNRFRARAGFRSGTQRKRGGTCRAAKTGRSHEIGRESDRQRGSRVRYRRKRRWYVDLM